MLNACAVLCIDGPVLLVGTDCPALTVSKFKQAAEVVRKGQDAAFLPAEDGGYVLVGLRKPANPCRNWTGAGWNQKSYGMWTGPTISIGCTPTVCPRKCLGRQIGEATSDAEIPSPCAPATRRTLPNRDVTADLRTAFGEEAPQIIGAALAADTDNRPRAW